MKFNVFVPIIACLLISLLFVIPATAIDNEGLLSREEAYDIVLSEILEKNTDGKWIYANPELIEAGTVIETWYGAINLPQERGWVFFIDDQPKGSWAHPCRYIHVDMTGVVLVQDAFGPPEDLIAWDKIGGSLLSTEIGTSSQSSVRFEASEVMGALPASTQSDHCYALIISGGENQYNNWPRYWYDCSFVYKTLVNDYGYQDDHIYVLISDGTDPGLDMHFLTDDDPDNPPVIYDVYTSSPSDLDGDGDDDVLEYSATYPNVTRVFDLLGDKLGTGDQLFIYTADHGCQFLDERGDPIPGSVGLHLWHDIIGDDQFATQLDKISDDVPIMITMTQCYSGGFVDDIIHDGLAEPQQRTIATSANDHEKCYGGRWSFSTPWISAVAGHDENGDAVDADEDDDGFISMQEAFTFAKEQCLSAYTEDHFITRPDPQFAEFPAGIGDSLSLSSGYAPVIGGPDNFGYTFVDSRSPGTVEYDWIEISSTGTPVLTSSDDSWIGDIPLGFFFNYYGTDYSRLAISNNGLLFSGGTTWEYVNEPIGNSPSVDGFISPYWDDIVTWGGSADVIYYQTIGSAPNRMFVVEWKDNQHYSSSTSGITFEAILFEGSNNIKFQYKDVDFGTVSGAVGGDNPPYNNGGSATVGIEGPDGVDGLQYSFNEPVIDPGLAIEFKFPQWEGTNLYLSKQAPESKDHGSLMTYTLHYHNFGDTSAPSTMLIDTLPTQATFESASSGGNYDWANNRVTWNLGTLTPEEHGFVTVTVRIDDDVPVGNILENTAVISTSNIEVRYDDNTATAVTRVTGSSLPADVGIEPNLGAYGGVVSVYWSSPITFTYNSCPEATGVDIQIHIDDGGPDIIDSMAGGPPEWTYTTVFNPRHGHATMTYTIHGCHTDEVTFEFYIDPAGFIYDAETGERIEGATVWLQQPDGTGDWQNVPTGEVPSIMLPDLNPQVTGPDGQYQWDVMAGSYRVYAEAAGYLPQASIVVSVPPPVTDLHIGLYRDPGANVPPQFEEMEDQNVCPGETVEFTVTATDPDGDDVEITTTTIPEGATFDGSVFCWTPQCGQEGEYRVTFTASDGSLTDEMVEVILVMDSSIPTPEFPTVFVPLTMAIGGMVLVWRLRDE